MNNVFWFTIIKQWREKGMGENGVTLPFLVGALTRQYTDNSGHPSLAFTEDLMNQFGLNCSTKEECLTKLISRTQMHTEKGEFSKNNGSFGDFTDDELEFLDRISVTASDE